MIELLPAKTRSQLRSSVAISSPCQCVEELVLNSLDAGATCIAIRVDLERFWIQVVDNGHGIAFEDIKKVGTRYMTSKCHALEDLACLSQYGYRGEALASIREISKSLEIQTRQKSSSTTYSIEFLEGKQGEISKYLYNRPSHGTTITVGDLFHGLPVRKKCFVECLELERIRECLEAFALIHPSVSFSLRNDSTQSVLLQSRKSNSVLGAFTHLFGCKLAKSLSEILHETDTFKLSGYVGKDGHPNKNIQFVFVNGRLVLKSKIHKTLNQLVAKSLIVQKNTRGKEHNIPSVQSTDPSSPVGEKELYPTFVIHLQCPHSEYDITFDPAKTLIKFREWGKLLDTLQDMITDFLKRENLLMRIEKGDGDGTTRGTEGDTDVSSSRPENPCEQTVSAGPVAYAGAISSYNTKDCLTSGTARRGVSAVSEFAPVEPESPDCQAESAPGLQGLHSKVAEGEAEGQEEMADSSNAGIVHQSNDDKKKTLSKSGSQTDETLLVCETEVESGTDRFHRKVEDTVAVGISDGPECEKNETDGNQMKSGVYDSDKETEMSGTGRIAYGDKYKDLSPDSQSELSVDELPDIVSSTQRKRKILNKCTEKLLSTPKKSKQNQEESELTCVPKKKGRFEESESNDSDIAEIYAPSVMKKKNGNEKLQKGDKLGTGLSCEFVKKRSYEVPEKSTRKERGFGKDCVVNMETPSEMKKKRSHEKFEKGEKLGTVVSSEFTKKKSLEVPEKSCTREERKSRKDCGVGMERRKFSTSTAAKDARGQGKDSRQNHRRSSSRIIERGRKTRRTLERQSVCEAANSEKNLKRYFANQKDKPGTKRNASLKRGERTKKHPENVDLVKNSSDFDEEDPFGVEKRTMGGHAESEADNCSSLQKLRSDNRTIEFEAKTGSRGLQSRTVPTSALWKRIRKMYRKTPSFLRFSRDREETGDDFQTPPNQMIPKSNTKAPRAMPGKTASESDLELRSESEAPEKDTNFPGRRDVTGTERDRRHTAAEISDEKSAARKLEDGENVVCPNVSRMVSGLGRVAEEAPQLSSVVRRSLSDKFSGLHGPSLSRTSAVPETSGMAQTVSSCSTNELLSKLVSADSFEAPQTRKLLEYGYPGGTMHTRMLEKNICTKDFCSSSDFASSREADLFIRPRPLRCGLPLLMSDTDENSTRGGAVLDTGRGRSGDTAGHNFSFGGVVFPATNGRSSERCKENSERTRSSSWLNERKKGNEPIMREEVPLNSDRGFSMLHSGNVQGSLARLESGSRCRELTECDQDSSYFADTRRNEFHGGNRQELHGSKPLNCCEEQRTRGRVTPIPKLSKLDAFISGNSSGLSGFPYSAALKDSRIQDMTPCFQRFADNTEVDSKSATERIEDDLLKWHWLPKRLGSIRNMERTLEGSVSFTRDKPKTRLDQSRPSRFLELPKQSSSSLVNTDEARSCSSGGVDFWKRGDETCNPKPVEKLAFPHPSYGSEHCQDWNTAVGAEERRQQAMERDRVFSQGSCDPRSYTSNQEFENRSSPKQLILHSENPSCAIGRRFVSTPNIAPSEKHRVELRQESFGSRENTSSWHLENHGKDWQFSKTLLNAVEEQRQNTLVTSVKQAGLGQRSYSSVEDSSSRPGLMQSGSFDFVQEPNLNTRGSFLAQDSHRPFLFLPLEKQTMDIPVQRRGPRPGSSGCQGNENDSSVVEKPTQDNQSHSQYQEEQRLAFEKQRIEMERGTFQQEEFRPPSHNLRQRTCAPSCQDVESHSMLVEEPTQGGHQSPEEQSRPFVTLEKQRKELEKGTIQRKESQPSSRKPYAENYDSTMDRHKPHAGGSAFIVEKGRTSTAERDFGSPEKDEIFMVSQGFDTRNVSAHLCSDSGPEVRDEIFSSQDAREKDIEDDSPIMCSQGFQLWDSKKQSEEIGSSEEDFQLQDSQKRAEELSKGEKFDENNNSKFEMPENEESDSLHNFRTVSCLTRPGGMSRCTQHKEKGSKVVHFEECNASARRQSSQECGSSGVTDKSSTKGAVLENQSVAVCKDRHPFLNTESDPTGTLNNLQVGLQRRDVSLDVSEENQQSSVFGENVLRDQIGRVQGRTGGVQCETVYFMKNNDKYSHAFRTGVKTTQSTNRNCLFEVENVTDNASTTETDTLHPACRFNVERLHKEKANGRAIENLPKVDSLVSPEVNEKCSDFCVYTPDLSEISREGVTESRCHQTVQNELKAPSKKLLLQRFLEEKNQVPSRDASLESSPRRECHSERPPAKTDLTVPGGSTCDSLCQNCETGTCDHTPVACESRPVSSTPVGVTSTCKNFGSTASGAIQMCNSLLSEARESRSTCQEQIFETCESRAMYPNVASNAIDCKSALPVRGESLSGSLWVNSSGTMATTLNLPSLCPTQLHESYMSAMKSGEKDNSSASTPDSVPIASQSLSELLHDSGSREHFGSETIRRRETPEWLKESCESLQARTTDLCDSGTFQVEQSQSLLARSNVQGTKVHGRNTDTGGSFTQEIRNALFEGSEDLFSSFPQTFEPRFKDVSFNNISVGVSEDPAHNLKEADPKDLGQRDFGSETENENRLSYPALGERKTSAARQDREVASLYSGEMETLCDSVGNGNERAPEKPNDAGICDKTKEMSEDCLTDAKQADVVELSEACGAARGRAVGGGVTDKHLVAEALLNRVNEHSKDTTIGQGCAKPADDASDEHRVVVKGTVGKMDAADKVPVADAAVVKEVMERNKGSCTYLSMVDPRTGKTMYIHLASGNTTFEKPEPSNQAPARNKPNRNDGYTQHPFLSHDAAPVMPRSKKKRQECPGTATSEMLTKLFQVHQDKQDGDRDVKWRDDGLFEDGRGGGVVEKMLSDWENPVFKRLPQEIMNIQKSEARRSARKVHNSTHSFKFTKDMFENIEVIGQVDQKFIACLMTTGDCLKTVEPSLLVFVDQHAAHERIRLEMLIDDLFDSEDSVKTVGVEPISISVGAQQVRVMLAQKDAYKKIGIRFSIPDRNKDVVMIKNVPKCLCKQEKADRVESRVKPSCPDGEVVTDLLNEQYQMLQESGGAAGTVPKSLLKVLWSQACHGAIKFGDSLSLTECEELLSSLSTCKLPFQCAHGRPSMMPIVDLMELENTLSDKSPNKPNLAELRTRRKEET